MFAGKQTFMNSLNGHRSDFSDENKAEVFFKDFKNNLNVNLEFCEGPHLL